MDGAAKRQASPGRDGDAGAGPSKEARTEDAQAGAAPDAAADAAAGADADADAPLSVVPAARRTCTHEVVYPEGWDAAAIEAHNAAAAARPLPTRPAKEFPFPLDTFQATAAECLERNTSVLVAAHTSAGKTVVAQYAFAMALRCVARRKHTHARARGRGGFAASGGCVRMRAAQRSARRIARATPGAPVHARTRDCPALRAAWLAQPLRSHAALVMCVQGRAARDLHVAAQGAVQPKVSGVHGRVRRRGAAHGRRDHQPQRNVPGTRHDAPACAAGCEP